jgi:hypothetical protein
VPHVKFLVEGKYPLETSPIPLGVSVEGAILGKISTLKFVDHDITDEKRFLEMARGMYLCAKSVPGT